MNGSPGSSTLTSTPYSARNARLFGRLARNLISNGHSSSLRPVLEPGKVLASSCSATLPICVMCQITVDLAMSSIQYTVFAFLVVKKEGLTCDSLPRPLALLHLRVFVHFEFHRVLDPLNLATRAYMHALARDRFRVRRFQRDRIALDGLNFENAFRA
jgi:hypothetical protein